MGKNKKKKEKMLHYACLVLRNIYALRTQWHYPIPISVSAIRTIFFGVVSMAQLVEVTVSAMLGGVVEVVSSNPALVIKIFQLLPAQLIYHISPYQSSL